MVSGVPAEILWELEAELANPPFLGVPIGSTLGDLFYLELHLGKLQSNLWGVTQNTLRYAYHWLKGCQGSKANIEHAASPYLLTWLNQKATLRDLVLPVAEGLGSEPTVVLGYRDSMAEAVRPNAAFLSLADGSGVQTKIWRTEYQRCAGIWHRKLLAFLKKHALPKRIFPRLADALLTQSQRVMALGNLLDTLQPRAVITEYDRNMWASCLLLAAKVRGIPTMTMVHGVVNAYGYTPLLADVAFCWGERQREQFIQLGTEPERLVVTGCPRLSRKLSLTSEAAKAKLEFPVDKPLILLGTNPIRLDMRVEFARVFCEGLSKVPEVSAAVRLHPSEKLEQYASLQAAFPKVKFYDNTAYSLDEALAAADVVVIHHSGLGNDALLKGKLTMVLDVLPIDLGNGLELVEQAGAPRLKNADDLSHAVARLCTDEPWRNELKAKAEAYVTQFCAAFGEQATLNIVAQIQQRAKPLAAN